MTKGEVALFDALSEHVMVYGGANRHDLLIGLGRLKDTLANADGNLREYEAESAHGATASGRFLDSCVSKAHANIRDALSLNRLGEFE